MINAFNSFLEAVRTALSKEQLADRFARLAATYGYDGTMIVNAAKLQSAIAVSMQVSASGAEPVLAKDARVPFLVHPLSRFAAQTDTPFDARRVCQEYAITEDDLRLGLPESLDGAQIMIFPVHKAGRLEILVGCSGAAPNTAAPVLGLLHTCAHLICDGIANLTGDTGLTPRQLDCLYWAAQGKTYPEIGKLLVIAPRTVRAELAKAKHTLQARTKSEAIAKAIGRRG